MPKHVLSPAYRQCLAAARHVPLRLQVCRAIWPDWFEQLMCHGASV